MTSTHPAPGVRTHIRPLNPGRHKVCNIACPVRGGPAELVLSEITGVCEMIEREMKGNGDLDLG